MPPATSKPSSRLPGIAIAVFAILLALLAVRSEGLDFRAFHVAAKASAAHLDPYRDNRQQGGQYADVANDNGMSRWIYPPPALFFVTPFSVLSFRTAQLLFGVVSIAGLMWVLNLLERQFRVSPIWVAMAGASIPVIACVQRGQVDLFILLCIVIAYRFSNNFWSGIPLGIAITIKIFPAALLLWWLLEKRYKQFATAISFVGILCGLAAWHFGVSSYVSFLHNLTTLHASASYVPLLGPLFSYSHGFVGSYNNPLVILGNHGIMIGVVLAAAAACYLRHKKVDSEVGFFGMVLISQVMNTALWTMGMVMFIPICMLAIGRLRSVVGAVLMLLPLYLPSQLRILGFTPRFIFAVLLLGWFVSTTSASREGPVPEAAYN